jgi:hypothetical protein
MGHELKHHYQNVDFWPNEYDISNDFDQDGIPDDIEATYMPGRPYDPFLYASYLDEIGYGVNPIPDAEDICMRSQSYPYGLTILWVNGSADHLDWSNPGKQHKNQD